jgi:hypothetical protein
MTSIFTSYKKTKGFKMFGKDWAPIHELNLYYCDLRYDESMMIRKIMHIGHKMSLPNCEDKDGYMLILKDLHKRIAEKTKEKHEIEDLIEESFNELVGRKQFTLS